MLLNENKRQEMCAPQLINVSESAREKNQLSSIGITLDSPQTSSRAKDGEYIYDGERVV